MADDDLDELDITKVPGVIPIPANTPNWKRSMMEKKNQEKIDEYKVTWEQEREARKAERDKIKAEEERRRIEEEKWSKLPEWKRKILQEKSKKEDQAKVPSTPVGMAGKQAATSKPATKQPSPVGSKQPAPPPANKPSKPVPPQQDKAKSGPQTKVQVLPPGPHVGLRKTAPVSNPSPPPPDPRDSLPVTVATVSDLPMDTYSGQADLESRTAAVSLKTPTKEMPGVSTRSIRVIKKGTGLI